MNESVKLCLQLQDLVIELVNELDRRLCLRVSLFDDRDVRDSFCTPRLFPRDTFYGKNYLMFLSLVGLELETSCPQPTSLTTRPDAWMLTGVLF